MLWFNIYSNNDSTRRVYWNLRNLNPFLHLQEFKSTSTVCSKVPLLRPFTTILQAEKRFGIITKGISEENSISIFLSCSCCVVVFFTIFTFFPPFMSKNVLEKIFRAEIIFLFFLLGWVRWHCQSGSLVTTTRSADAKQFNSFTTPTNERVL